MLFNYINLFFEVTAHVFRVIGACAVLLPFAYLVGSIALEMCNGLSVILGLMAVASVVLTAAAAYIELEQASEEVQAFRYWRAAVKKM